MDKIILKDLSEINIREGSSTNVFQVDATAREELATLCNRLTDDNLSEFSLYNSSSVLGAVTKNRKLSKASIEENTEEGATGFIITVELAEVSAIEKRVADVEETVDTLVLNSLGV